jgi:hypothetical protein
LLSLLTYGSHGGLVHQVSAAKYYTDSATGLVHQVSAAKYYSYSATTMNNLI